MSVTYKLGILTRSNIAHPQDGIWGLSSHIATNPNHITELISCPSKPSITSCTACSGAATLYPRPVKVVTLGGGIKTVGVEIIMW